jgi:hypothetical protein
MSYEKVFKKELKKHKKNLRDQNKRLIFAMH